MVVALDMVSVPAYQSLALSICFGLCVLAVSLPGGVIWFMSRKTKPAVHVHSAPQANSGFIPEQESKIG